jgi:hypothetical protein
MRYAEDAVSKTKINTPINYFILEQRHIFVTSGQNALQ